MQKLIIKGRLPGRNEAENAARSHWSVGAKLKKENTELVQWEAGEWTRDYHFLTYMRSSPTLSQEKQGLGLGTSRFASWGGKE